MKVQITDPTGISGYGNSSTGTFVTISTENEIRWLGRCRVEFEWALKRVKFHNRIGFLRYCGMNIELMEDFWSKIFKKLGNDSTFTISESNITDMCVIDLPPFWNDTDTARSLFSLLLRASVCYHVKGNTLIKTLKSYTLAVPVIPAIEWFLKGNTTPTYENCTKLDAEGYTGFVAEFQNLTDIEISQKLISKITQ